MEAVQQPQRDGESRDEQVPADWPELLRLHVWMVHEFDHWYAVCEDFNITGMGDNEADAMRDMVALVRAYLRAHAEDHSPYDQVLRPLPIGEQLRYRLRRAATPALRWLHRGTVAREGTYWFPQRLQGC